MLKQISQKIEKWTKRDYAKIISLYIANAIIIMAIMMGIAYVNCAGEGIDFFEYIKEFRKPIHLFVIIIMTLALSFWHFFINDKNFLKNVRNSEMLFLIVEISLLVVYAFGKYVNIYLRPVSIATLLVLFLTNRRTATFMSAVFAVLVLLMDIYTNNTVIVPHYTALIIGFGAGFVASFLMSNVYSRLKLLLLGAIISLPSLICVSLTLLESGLENVATAYICGFCSGPLAVALLIVILPFFELGFKRVSCFKLAELTDHKARLIKKLIVEAPGTFNHSIVVSNIAEACAIAIDEDALLARTCGYYHDIGKLRRPEYFKENQADGANPHDNLTPELSTNIIKSHTNDGYHLAIKNGLPKIIADICLQHHGTMPILYFYDKAKKFTDGQVDIAQYSYSGPKPQTKIAAIIMIADGCEAVTRSLKNRSRENVMKAVRKIVNDRMSLGQFDECEITIKELNIIIHTVVNNLTGVYHKRVEYPKVNLDGIATELIKEDKEAVEE